MVHALLSNGGTRCILRARHHADIALRLAPDEPSSHSVDAQVAVRMGRITVARLAYQRVMALARTIRRPDTTSPSWTGVAGGSTGPSAGSARRWQWRRPARNPN